MKSNKAWPIQKLLSTVGRTVRLRFSNTLSFDATVHDAKISWGKARIRVAPVAGVGLDWVEASRIVSVTPPLNEPVTIPPGFADVREAHREEPISKNSDWMKE